MSDTYNAHIYTVVTSGLAMRYTISSTTSENRSNWNCANYVYNDFKHTQKRESRMEWKIAYVCPRCVSLFIFF